MPWNAKLINHSLQVRINDSRSFSFWLAPIPVIPIYLNCTHRPYYGVENDCRNFRSIRMDSFLQKSKKVEKWLFFGHFWANFGYVSHIQDGCTSSQNRLVDGCEKLITMTDVLKVFHGLLYVFNFGPLSITTAIFFTEPTAKSHGVTGNSFVSSACRLTRLKKLRR